MLTKLFTSIVTFGLFAYGVNSPIGSKSGDYAILAGIAILVGIVVFKKIVAPSLVKAKLGLDNFIVNLVNGSPELKSRLAVTKIVTIEVEKPKAKRQYTKKTHKVTN